MFKRASKLPSLRKESFFLWGQRSCGKTTLLRESFPEAIYIDLLRSEAYRKYSTRPETLREELETTSATSPVIIDEVQRVPTLLNEVHWLIENRQRHFGLCGSSARKVKRGHANLLGGRALRYELYGLVSAEFGRSFELERALNHGSLPSIYLADEPMIHLEAYVANYLKEEIASEGLVRNIGGFSNFLEIASLSDAEIVNFSTIARETGVSSQTIKGYFDILTDTLTGHWLPAFTKRPKRKVIQSAKFYFADIGVVRFLAKRGHVAPGSELFGKALENWIHHEIRTYLEYTKVFTSFSYWRLKSGIEVDFVLGNADIGIETKASSRIRSEHTKGLEALEQDHPRLQRKILVCLENERRITSEKIEIMPVKEFLSDLWQGKIVKQI